MFGFNISYRIIFFVSFFFSLIPGAYSENSFENSSAVLNVIQAHRKLNNFDSAAFYCSVLEDRLNSLDQTKTSDSVFQNVRFRLNVEYGKLRFSIKDRHGAIDVLYKNLNLIDQIREDEILCEYYFFLGQYLLSIDNIVDSKVWLTKCLTLANKLNLEKYIGSAHINLGIISHREGQLSKANRHLDSAKIIYARDENYEKLCAILVNQGNLLRAEGKIEDALLIYKDAKNISINKDSCYLDRIYLNIGILEFSRDNYSKAIEYFNKSKDLIPLNKVNNNKITFDYLAATHEKLGHFKESLGYYKAADSMASRLYSDKIDNLVLKHSLDSKLSLMNFNKSLLQAELKQESKRRKIIVIAAGVLIVLLVLLIAAIIQTNIKEKQLFNTESEKKENQNKLLQIKHDNIEELSAKRIKNELAMEVHDNILSNLSGCKIALQSLSTRLDETDNKLIKTGLVQIVANLNQAYVEVKKYVRALQNDNQLSTKNEFISDVRNYISRIDRSTDLNILIKQDDSLQKELNLGDNAQVQLLRVLQEVFNNIIRHSRANSVIFEMKVRGRFFYVSVMDNGIGFQISSISLDGGISYIRQRLSKIYGQVIFTSSEGLGTLIEIKVPI